MTSFSIEPIYASPWIVAFAAMMVVAVIAVVAPPTDDPKKRRWLIALRSFAGLVLLLAAVRPTLVHSDNRPSPAELLIAVDTSKSMTLPDGEGSTRWKTQLDAVTKLLDGISDLDESLDVQIIGYADQSTSIGKAVDRESFGELDQKINSLSASGNLTDLGSGIKGAIDAASSKTLAGVVLLGDGMQTTTTAGPSSESSSTNTSLGARYGAQVLDALGVPLWTVPIGPPATGITSRDVAIANLPDHLQLFSGNQFDLSFTVETTGLSSIQVPISVNWINDAGEREQVRTRKLDPRSARESIAVNLSIDAPKPGVYRLEVVADNQDGEWVTSNNVQTAFVEVREGGGRILIFEGPGRPELAFLRRALRGFPDLDLRFATIRGDQQWPISIEAALAPNRFDVYIIGDVDAGAFGEAQLQMIADRVGEGTGLITLGGLSNYSLGGYADSPLQSVLPIGLDASQRRPPVRSAFSPAERQARVQSQIEGPIEIQVARQHPIISMGGASNASIWKELPSLTGANRFTAKPASGIQTLLETDGEQPLLVVGNYGKGRVASLAFDETYRWWRVGKSEVHRRFWRQLMLWVMSREETNGDSVIAELENRRFETDAQPTFQARVQTLLERETPIRMTASIIDSDGRSTDLDVTESTNPSSRISGRFPKLDPGFYKLIVEANDSGISNDEIAFQVVETSRELANPLADFVYLQQLADLTEQHGGASFDVTQLEPLIETIRSKRRSAETLVIEKFSLGDGPISGWIVFLLFTTAMSVEWWLRRKWQLA
ncbi:glutamine amidotransferase [Stieleria sp. JC731]|uniref:glutamine amidotransferase n=1 Tax=Pirellulaceae TaxID=2691357 RepID=UPI001E451D26|nr:glutamine amidotransferase [Stieleria sp. JC731]MCC9604183.1 glutamine amidotransferase [Stieleria sp. JC731]